MSTDHPHAPLIKILAALVYDSLIIMALAMAYGAIYIGVKYSVLSATELPVGERAQMETEGLVGLLLLIEAFYWFFWCRGGQTLGMKAWRLQTVDASSGGSVSILQAMVRGLIGPFSLLIFGLGYAFRSLHKQKRSWHDLASNTKVIQLPKL